jgi:hypothetical protein
LTWQNPDVDKLTDALLTEIQGVLGLAGKRWAEGFVRLIFGSASKRMALLLVKLEEDVVRLGFGVAAERLLDSLVDGFQVEFHQAIPKEGPLLIVSNHPGAYDIALLAASAGRDDLAIISSDIVVLPHLPYLAEHFIPITNDPYRRMIAFRIALRHLQAGKALLLFPRGEVEVDPALSPEGWQDMSSWSNSLELFIRGAEGTRMVVAIVSGVLSKHWYNHPVLRIWKGCEQRQKVAEIIQIGERLLFSRKADINPKVSFSKALAFDGGESMTPSPGWLMPILTEAAREQMQVVG